MSKPKPLAPPNPNLQFYNPEKCTRTTRAENLRLMAEARQRMADRFPVEPLEEEADTNDDA